LIVSILSAIFFQDSEFVQFVSFEAGILLILLIFGIKTTSEFEKSTTNYIEWIFSKDIGWGAFGMTIYLFF